MEHHRKNNHHSTSRNRSIFVDSSVAHLLLLKSKEIDQSQKSESISPLAPLIERSESAHVIELFRIAK
jgi:hypothetical protein